MDQEIPLDPGNGVLVLQSPLILAQVFQNRPHRLVLKSRILRKVENIGLIVLRLPSLDLHHADMAILELV